MPETSPASGPLLTKKALFLRTIDNTALPMSEKNAYQTIRVAVALLIGIVATLIVWMFLGTIFAAMLPEKPPVGEEVATTSAVFLAIAAAVISSIIGGYITTVIASDFGLAGSFLLGVALIVLFEPLAREAAPFPTWGRFTLMIVFIPATVFGGLAQRRMQSQTNQQQTSKQNAPD